MTQMVMGAEANCALNSIDKDQLVESFVKVLSEHAKVEADDVDTSKAFTSYGLDSIVAFTMACDIEDLYAIELPATLFWDCNNIDEATDYIVNNYAELCC